MKNQSIFIIGTFLAIFIKFTHAWGCGQLPKGYAYPTIIGGRRADEGSWPWIVSIRLAANNGREHICAGTMIGKRFVLTAGHCMMKRKRRARRASELLVVVGTQTLAAPYSSPKESVIDVKKIHMHPLYNHPTVRPWAYDMAILELDEEPEHEEVSRPACVPLDNVAPTNGEQCIVAGWGKTERRRFSKTLMQARLPIVSRRECNRADYWDGYIDRSMLCALNRNKEPASACQGDSGGPLICERDNQWYVYGVISWGPIVCGDKPGVFTNVAHVADWVQSILEEADEDIDPGSKANQPKNGLVARTMTDSRRGSNPARPPCDAVQFERKYGYVIYGPAPRDYVMLDVSVRDCMSICCERGGGECQSFLYYHKERKCMMRKITRCDRNGMFIEQSTYNQDKFGPVTYYGKKECRRKL